MLIILMASKGKNNEIGKNNELIWKLKYIEKKIKQKTKEKVLVMGRNTFNSIKEILSDREYIILSKTKRFNKSLQPNVKVIDNVIELIKKCRELSNKKDIYIIGGESMYKLFIDYADKMYIAKINELDNEADAFFPYIDSKEWTENILEKKCEKDIDFSFVEYTKKK